MAGYRERLYPVACLLVPGVPSQTLGCAACGGIRWAARPAREEGEARQRSNVAGQRFRFYGLRLPAREALVTLPHGFPIAPKLPLDKSHKGLYQLLALIDRWS
jgi:hypothetical protein